MKICFLVLLLVGLMVMPSGLSVLTAPISTFTVNALNDVTDDTPGDGQCDAFSPNHVCTLRAAIVEANAHVGPDTIILPSDTILLTRTGADEEFADTGDLDIYGTLTISGTSSSTSIIDAANLHDRVFHIQSGANVIMSGVMIRNANVTTATVAYGGAIYNEGALFLDDGVLSNNSAKTGGGIHNASPAVLTVTNSLLEDNNASQDAGAIVNFSRLSLTNSTLRLNQTNGYGGGLLNYGQAIVTSNVFTQNTSHQMGGGIHNAGTITVSNSVLAKNSADHGGGIAVGLGSLVMTRTTITDNKANLGVGGGIYVSSGVASLDWVTVTNNYADNDGGGIRNSGTMTANNVVVMNNTANTLGGGGIFTTHDLSLNAGSVMSNTSNADGGGIYAKYLGFNTQYPITITNSAINQNIASNVGGGIFAEDGALFVNASTVNDNRAFHGGGFFLELSATLSLANSTVYSNTANGSSTGNGGGIFNIGPSVAITRSTFDKNSATNDGGGIHIIGGELILDSSTFSYNHAGLNGGGIYVSADVTATNVTVSNNNAYGSGGGIYLSGGSLNTFHLTIATNTADADDSGGGVGGGIRRNNGTANLRGTIIAYNSNATGGFAINDDCYGTINSFAYSLLSDNANCTITTSTNPRINIDPQLRVLANNGGPTKTRALKNNSPAIDWILIANCKDANGNTLFVDQRGQRRPADGNHNGTYSCDIGAYEFIGSLFLPFIQR